MIDYRCTKPTIQAYKDLFESTGWTSTVTITDDNIQDVIKNTWYWVCVYDNENLIGIGRIISDGALYGLICDIIVLPTYQNQGIGSAIIKMLKSECAERKLQRVWLFAASGKSDFYIKNGFEIRSIDAPGMQMK
jgi:ribosomal protein S18 acetylase RimI-like enzyme